MEISFDEKIKNICDLALTLIGLNHLKFRPMRRKDNSINTKRSFVIGRTNLKTGLITIDIFTPTKREPKKISSILRTLAHETAHHQKLPFRQRYKGHIIIRSHYPDFYQQVNKNILLFKSNKTLQQYFIA